LINLSKIKKNISNMPPLVKWILSVILGGFIYKGAETIVNAYIKFGFSNINDVTAAFRTQYLIDILLIFVIAILLVSVLDMQRRYG
jgi:hypothetical protein